MAPTSADVSIAGDVHQLTLDVAQAQWPYYLTPCAAVCFRCSVRTDCQDAAEDVLYWINYKSDRCTTIESVSPHQLQATTARTVSWRQASHRVVVGKQ